MQDTLTAALEYAQLGYRVLPLKPGTKVPDLRHWPEEASTNPDVIRHHWMLSRRRAPAGSTPNVGICTGAGLAVVDVDTHHGGEIPAWLNTETQAVRTPSGGLHFYYAVSGFVPNSVGRLAPGIDIRGERGQVAAPPSLIETPFSERARIDLPAERRYEWLNDLPVATIDTALLIPEDMKHSFEGTRRKFEYRDEVPVGERNNYLTSLAGYLYALGETFNEVLAALQIEADTLGFTPAPSEIKRIAQSVQRYH